MPAPRSLVPLLLLALGVACDSTSDENGPILASDLAGRWLITAQASDSTLSCSFRDVILDLAAADSTQLHAIYGPGLQTCVGHGFTTADTMILLAQNPDTVVLSGNQLDIVFNAAADTVAGTVISDLKHLSGSLVTRGTVVADNYSFTMRGTWQARRAPVD